MMMMMMMMMMVMMFADQKLHVCVPGHAWMPVDQKQNQLS